MNSEQEIERIEEMVKFYARIMSPMDNWVLNIDGTATIYAPTPIPEAILREFGELSDDSNVPR